MILRKVSGSDRNIMKKYRTLYSSGVSFWADEFDPDGYVQPISHNNQKPKPRYGTNKKEWRVSQCDLVHGWRGRVNG